MIDLNRSLLEIYEAAGEGLLNNPALMEAIESLKDKIENMEQQAEDAAYEAMEEHERLSMDDQ